MCKWIAAVSQANDSQANMLHLMYKPAEEKAKAQQEENARQFEAQAEMAKQTAERKKVEAAEKLLLEREQAKAAAAAAAEVHPEVVAGDAGAVAVSCKIRSRYEPGFD